VFGRGDVTEIEPKRQIFDIFWSLKKDFFVTTDILDVTGHIA
jgi:hypothetical protein